MVDGVNILVYVNIIILPIAFFIERKGKIELFITPIPKVFNNVFLFVGLAILIG